MNVAAATIRQWRHNPNLFVRQCLKVQEVDAWQDEVLEAYNTHQRIALKASKGPGKSTVLAWIGWHFLLCWPHPKAVATSISGDNLRDNLWSEMSKWQQRSELLRQAFHWGAERITAVDHPETWWMSARSWPKGADASQQANTLAGVHADHVLFLVDESGGIPDAVMAAAEGGLANADPAKGTTAKLVQAGNPTHLEGPLYRACTRERRLWWVKEISGDPDDPNRAPRVSKQWAREQIEKYGRDSPYVLVNVFGQFPPAQSNKLIGINEVSAAARRSASGAEYVYAPKILGVDVARFGDDQSVIQPRQGCMAYKPKEFRNIDTMQLAGQVAMAIGDWQPDATFIDVTGIGAGVVDRLMQSGFDVVGVNFASSPLTQQPRLLNKRAEMWWLMADWLRQGGCIPDDGELMADLEGPTYRFDKAGRIQLESKEEMKGRGLQSPDKGDALCLTFAMPVQARQRHGAQKGPGVLTDYNPLEA